MSAQRYRLSADDVIARAKRKRLKQIAEDAASLTAIATRALTPTDRYDIEQAIVRRRSVLAAGDVL